MYIEKRFDLNSGYLRRAKAQGTKLNLTIIEKYGTLIVSLPENISKLISAGYIAVRVNQDDCLDLYEYIYSLTKSTRIGFYK